MEYFVYAENFNARRIERYNVLSCYDSMIKKMRKTLNYEEFSEKLMREMQCRFWSRCEYEVLISIDDNDRIILSPWIAGKNDCYYLDVTDDDLIDWKAFAHKHIDKQNYPHKKEAKVDIFDQLMFKKKEFVDYCWNYYTISPTSGRIVLNKGVKK